MHETKTARKTKMLKNKDFLSFQSLSGFVMLIDIKIPTIVELS